MQYVYNKHPSNENQCKLRQARKDAKQMVRRCANDYWVELSQHIENESATGNIRAMYEVSNLQHAPLRANQPI